MKAIELEAQPREIKKRNRAKALRSSGRVPGVVYGQGNNRLVDVDNKQFDHIMHNTTGDTVLLDLGLGGEKSLVLVQEVQHHPLSRQTLHIDFREVKPDQPVVINVPTIPVGEAVGVKTSGGNMEHVMHFVKVRGTPASLPESIEVDVSELDIGHTLHLGDIEFPEGIEAIGNASNPVVSITRPRVIEEVTTAEEGEEGEEGEGAEGEEGGEAAEGEKAEGGE